MAISFADSLKAIREAGNLSVAIANETVDNVEAYSNDEWISDTNYLVYEDYEDLAFSYIDGHKSITLNASQINLSQEANSQYIPFEMNRYYDGVDLTTKTLSFFFLTADGMTGEDHPVNVTYNAEKIRFAWLVDRRVTSAAGRVQFEIYATGTNTKGEKYIWKTRPTDKLTVLPSISDLT